ncbi:MAG TPA: periplasmic heavy metal sensor [Verrucomicrobiae bacterium]|nr:periplasmic heavy metal sensor [Verrucomicrobiae bacterium]
MKRLLLMVAIAALVATAVSFGTARWFAARQPRSATMLTLHDTAWLKQNLHLTPAQAGEIEKFEAEFQKQFAQMCAAHCNARLALGDELAKPRPDPVKAQACVQRMNKAQADAEHATLEHILKVRTVLTDEQARRYGQLVRDQVCSVIPGGAM